MLLNFLIKLKKHIKEKLLKLNKILPLCHLPHLGATIKEIFYQQLGLAKITIWMKQISTFDLKKYILKSVIKNNMIMLPNTLF